MDAHVNSANQCEALCGLVLFACDWHAKVNFMSLCIVLLHVKYHCNIFLHLLHVIPK